MPPVVTIIIPVYNAAPFLARSINSALTQVQGKGTQEPAKVAGELILVDNNSTDGSLEILNGYAAQFPEIVRVVQCKKQGASAARNVGIAVAKGKWIQFLDADDELLLGKISGQLTNCQPDTSWVIAPYRQQYPDGSTVDNFPHADPWKGLVYLYRIGNVCANLYRRDTLQIVGGFDETLPNNEDPDLHFRLLKSQTPFYLAERVHTIYHQHDAPTRLSRSNLAGGQLRRAGLLVAINHYLRRHRPVYWTTNKHYFQGALLRALRMLATYLPVEAVSLYQQEFVNQAEARRLLPLVPKHFQYLHWALGFGPVERARTKLGRLRRWVT